MRSSSIGELLPFPPALLKAGSSGYGPKSQCVGSYFTLHFCTPHQLCICQTSCLAQAHFSGTRYDHIQGMLADHIQGMLADQ